MAYIEYFCSCLQNIIYLLAEIYSSGVKHDNLYFSSFDYRGFWQAFVSFIIESSFDVNHSIYESYKVYVSHKFVSSANKENAIALVVLLTV